MYLLDLGFLIMITWLRFIDIELRENWEIDLFWCYFFIWFNISFILFGIIRLFLIFNWDLLLLSFYLFNLSNYSIYYHAFLILIWLFLN